MDPEENAAVFPSGIAIRRPEWPAMPSVSVRCVCTRGCSVRQQCQAAVKSLLTCRCIALGTNMGKGTGVLKWQATTKPVEFFYLRIDIRWRQLPSQGYRMMH